MSRELSGTMHRPGIAARRWLLACSALLAGVSQAAAIYQAGNDAGSYGRLDQHTVCGNTVLGCGPTAAANSLVFLESRGLPAGTLIPRVPGNDFDTDLRATADKLATDYMGTTPTGTQVPPFLLGLNRYLGDRLAGVAPFKMDAMWGGTWNTTQWGARPGFVADVTVPTWQFIYERLRTGWDVEIALDGRGADGTRSEGHYLTVTGFYFADFDFDGLIDQAAGADPGDIAYFDYIDPWSGTAGQAKLWDRQGTPNIMGTDYVGIDHQHNGAASGKLALNDPRIIGVFALRVPEPGTAALVGLALVLLAPRRSARRRRAGAPEA